ncbi:hypothetical protein FIV38_21920 [Pseudomonas proteolytica]|nr:MULTISPECIES: hypothetical protein [Pseudomonas]KAA8699915.1 hypothetical protein F4W61_19800 [Pseudomonas proteolytica]QHG24742.1 hypothetical protein GDV60_18515 [Pseudomonas sp. DTU12.1]TWR77220.1 hypothetical protein FIV38_21920 [Pseudomonas proteolytica]SEE76900.1 hypothetical protein SAMN04490200_5339 [Pseudomonas proteolytica]
MTQWRTQGFYILLGLLLVFTCYTGAILSGDGPSKRKRVCGPGFVMLCVFVAVLELIVLNHFYNRRV